MNKSFSRKLRAELRDARVLLRESRFALAVFTLLLFGGALLVNLFYSFPETGQRPTYPEALFGTFTLIFLQPYFPFPDEWYLQILFFIIPILGLSTIADGVVHFWTALTNKKERGEKWQVAMASTYSNHVIVCGFGKVGYRVAQELIKFGREVIAIENDPAGRFVDKAEDLGITLLIADARRTKTLIDANVKKADAIIPCTDDELANLDIALDARELNPDIKVVMRMFDPDLAKRVEKGFGIHTAFSTSALTAPIFAAAAMRANVKYSFYVDNQLLNISEVVIGPQSRLAGWNVGKLENDMDLSVVFFQKGKVSDLHPKAETILEPGAKILVLGTLDALKQLTALNTNP